MTVTIGVAPAWLIRGASAFALGSDVPAGVQTSPTTKELFMTVTIGVDPHKGSHTAVALDEQETVLGQLRVRSGPDQLVRLSKWAEAWPGRSWAVENASGLGYLLSQQLVAAGERVVDVGRSWPPGHGSWTTATSTRTTPTTPALSLWPLSGQNACQKSQKRTMPES